MTLKLDKSSTGNHFRALSLRCINTEKTAEPWARRVGVCGVLSWGCFYLSYSQLPVLMCTFSQGGQAMRPGSWGWWGLSHFVAVDDAQASSTVSGGEDLSHGWGKHITGWGLCTCTEETRKGERAQKKVKARVGLKMAQSWNVFFYTHWSTGCRKKPYWLKVFEYKLSPITGRLLSYEETQPTPREPGLKLKTRKKQKQ